MKFSSGNSQKGGVKEMLMVSLPMVMSMSFDTFLVFINRLFLSKLGPDYMNASLIGGLTEMVVIMFFNGVISYSTAMVAQNFGAQKISRCSLVTAQALFIALCCYPIALALIPPAHIFLNSFNVPELQSTLQIQYFDILVYGCIITMFRHALACFFIGLGKTRIVMTATLTGLMVTLVLSYGFTFGKLGLPALDIVGAPVAVIIGNFTALCFLLVKFFSKEYRENYSTHKCWRLSKRILSTLIKKGLPSGSEMFLNMLAFLTLILLFDTQGLVAATATSIMFNWDLVAFVPLIGLEVGATSLVGKYVGARDFASANRVTYSGIKIGLGYAGIIILLFVGIPEILVNVFTPHEIIPEWDEARILAINMLRLAAIYVTVETFIVIYAGALRGAGDTMAVLFIASGLHWLLVGIVWVFFNIFQANVLQTWGFTVLIFTIWPLFLFLRWKNGKWRRMWEVKFLNSPNNV
ncbi:MAG: MATE family efflux transporter [Fibromonadaceae bacterium]|jgi:MATE family multidrug resistance protein|nr:MATE family efflux transporter [Fibromonadaceae bacterium]